MTLEREAASSPTRAKPRTASPGRAVAPGVESVAGVLALQRAAGNSAVQALLSRAVLQRRVGWTGVDSKSWNFGPRDVVDKRVKRIPVEGIAMGHASGAVDRAHPDVPKQDDATESVDDPATGKFKKVSELTPETAGGVTAGRAVVLIPYGLPEGTVEVLFHLHGFTPGGRGLGPTGTDEPEDVSAARIAQQLEASGRPMIAILPQGTRKAGFWADPSKFDLNTYIDQALDLVPADQWPGKKKRTPGHVVLSAHSGGGDVLAFAMQDKRLSSSRAGDRSVEGLLLFDAMHGWGPGAVATFLEARLDEELAQLHEIFKSNPSATPESIADDQVTWLKKSGFRFRGFASKRLGYFKRYDTEFKPKLAEWFTSHVSQLGGADSCVFQTLRANYLDQAAVDAGTEHEQIVGGTVAGGTREHQHLLDALGAKPPELTDCKRTPAQPPKKKAAPPRRAKVARRTLSRALGWAGAKKGSTNAAPRTTKDTSVRRVPVSGIAAGRGPGNALVLIPEWLKTAKTVEVLLHLHGHEVSGFPAGYQSAEDESLYRVEQALDQFKDSKRPIIAVLPQGGTLSEFGHDASDFNAGVYIQQAIAEVPADQWPGGSAPSAGGVILSGHSGAGGRFASMFGTTKMPGRLESFFSFDTINGKTGQKVSEIEQGPEYKAHVAFVLGRLDADLAMLKDERAKAASKKEEEIQAALAAKLVADGFRFRAFYSGSPNLKPGDPKALNPAAAAGYADRYFLLKGKVDDWFDAHAGDLGGKGSRLYDALRANYTIEPTGTEHMQDMGGIQERKGGPWTHENLRSALAALPTTPQGGP